MKNKSSRKIMANRVKKKMSFNGTVILNYKKPVHKEQLHDDFLDIDNRLKTAKEKVIG